GALIVAYFHLRRRQGALTATNGLRDLVVLLAGAGAAGAVQLSYNWYAHGTVVLSSYGTEAFEWRRPMQLAVLVSYERGLFSYFPVVALVLASAWAMRRTRLAAAWFSLLVLAYVVLYGYWSSWMLGCGFGHRGFVELMPLGLVL